MVSSGVILVFIIFLVNLVPVIKLIKIDKKNISFKDCLSIYTMGIISTIVTIFIIISMSKKI